MLFLGGNFTIESNRTIHDFILFCIFSRSSDSSTPRPGSQANRASSTGSGAANSNSPTTPATAALSSSVWFLSILKNFA